MKPIPALCIGIAAGLLIGCIAMFFALSKLIIEPQREETRKNEMLDRYYVQRIETLARIRLKTTEEWRQWAIAEQATNP